MPVNARVAELIKTEEDLSHVAGLKQRFQREKQTLHADLNSAILERFSQLMATLGHLNDASGKLQEVRANLVRINDVHDESKAAILQYDVIKQFTNLQAFFDEANTLMANIRNFPEALVHIRRLLVAEEEAGIDTDLEVPNLLEIHYSLTQARNFLDRLVQWARTCNSDTQLLTQRVVEGLPPLVEKFDMLLEAIIQMLTEMAKFGNVLLVMRVLKVVEFEEREDLKLVLRANVDAKGGEGGVNGAGTASANGGHRARNGTGMGFSTSANGVLADHIPSIPASDGTQTSVRLQQRNYFRFFWTTVRELVEGTHQNCQNHFENPYEVLDNVDWVFADLEVVQQKLVHITPTRWRVFDRYYEFHHGCLQKFVTEQLVAKDPTTDQLLRILDFEKHYTSTMQSELGLKKAQVRQLFDDKDAFLDLCVGLLCASLAEWMQNLELRERQEFRMREHRPATMEPGLWGDSNTYLTLQATTTVFQMFNLQLNTAADSGYGRIVAGVVKGFCGVLDARNDKWEELLQLEVGALLRQSLSRGAADAAPLRNLQGYADEGESGLAGLRAASGANTAGLDVEVQGGLVEYVSALANDQVRLVLYTETISEQFLPIVLRKYELEMLASLEKTLFRFSSLGRTCVHHLLRIMFADLEPLFDLVLGPEWYKNKGDTAELTKQILETLMDYLADFAAFLTPVLFGILLNQCADYTLLYYLRGLRLRQMFKTKTIDRVRRDIGELVPVLARFYTQDSDAASSTAASGTAASGSVRESVAGGDDLSVSTLQRKFVILECFMDMVTADPQQMEAMFASALLPTFPDVPASFVSAVLQCRKDLDLSTSWQVVEKFKEIQTDHKYASGVGSVGATFMREFLLEADLLGLHS